MHEHVAACWPTFTRTEALLVNAAALQSAGMMDTADEGVVEEDEEE